VRLTPLETLIKNIILLPLSVLMLRDSKRGRFNYLGAATVVAISLGVCLYALRHQPLIDFMPYREGVNLSSEIARERDLAQEQSTTSLVFRTSEGEELLFASDDVECWLRDDIEFVESRTETSIADPLPFAEFIITNSQGDDVTLDVISENSDVTLLCIHSAKSLRGARLSAVRELLNGHNEVVVISSDSPSRIREALGIEPYSLDAMTLRSMMRADIGVVVLSDGVVESKANIRDL
jgi:hypothetical protein